MFRKRLVALCMLTAATILGGVAVPQKTAAQPAEEGGDPKTVDIDLDDTESKQQGPVIAGQMTAEAAKAKKLFDRERWSDAALSLYRVVSGDTGDDAGNKQLAEYYLAIALYRLKFYQASYSVFSVIADNQNHLKFKETLLWLAKLATQLPEPADIIERVGKYTDTEIARFDNEQQRNLYWQLNYMLGRYKYRNRQYPEAVRLFNMVDRESEYYVKAQFFSGISYVQLRKSVPAIKNFERVEAAVDEGVKGIEDEARMRDLAYLSMARTFYSASVRLDPETNTPNVDPVKLSAAVKYWNLIDVASEYWLDALFEESWAYFMAGDYPRALGNIHTLESPYFPGSFYPESQVLKSVIYFANCNYDAATIVVAKFNKKYIPIREGLGKVLARFRGANQEEPFYKFLKKVREGEANLDENIRPLVENALSDRQLLRNLEYVRLLDDELGRFKKSPDRLRSSGVGGQVQDALRLARELAVRRTGQLAIQRYQRYLDELNEHLRNGEKILIDITAAQRNLLDEAIKKQQVTQEESKIYGVVNPDEEHTLWPFDGEYWRDELGFYRAVVQSACAK
ncbi:hypothetical protein ACFL5O_08775 [Myxococcota bacterium]